MRMLAVRINVNDVIKAVDATTDKAETEEHLAGFEPQMQVENMASKKKWKKDEKILHPLLRAEQ